jgi:hypothetical protein
MKRNFIATSSLVVLSLLLTAFPHRAAAQMANTNSKILTLPRNGVATLNTITLPKAGTYVITGQQSFSASPTATAETPVTCFTANQAGSNMPIPTGPYSWTTITPPGGYATLPLNGYLTVTGPTQIWEECIYWGTEVLESINSSIAATQVQ